MPEAEKPKCYHKIDAKPLKWYCSNDEIYRMQWEKPLQDPVQICKTFSCLVIVGEEEVVEESDGQPDQVGAEEEELPGDQLHPPGTNSQQW